MVWPPGKVEDCWKHKPLTCPATLEHVALQLEGYMEALRENPPSHPIQPTVSMQSSLELS